MSQINIFLDSGAFSAFSQGKQIDIQKYIEFIKKNITVFSVYANLDVIGDPEATYKNQKIMEGTGLSPIPTFHYGEDVKWLLKYLEEGYDYIALGGMVPISSVSLKIWLDYLFSNFLCDFSGTPVVKVHGFGLSSLNLMLRYPWFSVDSSSWNVAGRLGFIYVPRFRNKKRIYDENAWKIAVSSRSPKIKEAGEHINNFPPKQKELILEYIHSKGFQLGKSSFKIVSINYELKENERWADEKPKNKDTQRLVEIIEEIGISNDYGLRNEMNIIYFYDLVNTLPEWPWAFEKKSQLLEF